jgi:hypothetical protein
VPRLNLAYLSGFVLTKDNEPAAHATIRVGWTRLIVHPSSIRVQSLEATLEADDAGEFGLCAVARERPVTISATSKDSTAASAQPLTIELLGDQAARRVGIRLVPRTATGHRE